MRTSRKTIKNVFCCATGVAMLAGAGVGLFHNFNKNVTYEAGSNVSSIPVSIPNSDFNSNTSYTMPFAPNSYTPSGDVKNSNVKAGVINLENSNYINTFDAAQRDSLHDKYVLMIDSHENIANFGYTTSNAITMSANSNYMLSVDVYTESNSNVANLYLYEQDDNSEYTKTFSSIENINSYKRWTTYYFFVTTNEEDVNVKLGMTLEGKGVALFDNISCFKLSTNNLNNHLNGLSADIYEYENNVDNVIKNYTIKNNEFVIATQNPIVEKSAVHSITGASVDSLTTINTETDGTNTGALKLSVLAENKGVSTYETEDDFLTFESNRLYKVTINTKLENLSGKATLKLVQTGLEEDETGTDSGAISISSNTGSSENVTNNYQAYSFYVKSHPTKTTTYKLQFGLGDNSTASSGDMYISNVAVSKINYSVYSSASTGTSAQKIDLVSTEDVSYDLTNGQFNDIQIEDYNSIFPATPASWIVEKGTGSQHYGVVNTEASNFATLSSIGVTVNPNSGENNNVLLLQNDQADTLSYKSATTNVSANTYQKFDIDVQTFNSNVKVALVTTKNDKEIELVSRTISTTVKTWDTVTLYLHTGYESLDVAVKVTLTTEGAGYAFVDNAYLNYPTAKASEFNYILSNPNSLQAAVDLKDLFSSIDFYTTTGNINTVKIVDLTTENLSQYVSSENVGAFSSINADKVLAIRSLSDTNFTITSNLGFSLATDKYYKISVDVYTRDIDTNNSEIDKDTIGATLALTDLENASFTQVKSNNEWSTYTFYVKADTATTTYLSVSLGSDTAECKGDVYVGNIQIDETITEDAFNNVTEGSTVKLIKKVEEEKEDETTDNTKNNSNNFNWVYLIPSIAFPLAIIICIVGVALRKIKWKKPVKKTKNTYDRNRTVSKQVLARKATMAKEEKLHELNLDLEKMVAERNKYEEEYKHGLTKLREMKIKRANPADIAKLEKDMKKNQKLTASIGVTVNKIKNEIDYVNTDAYFNSLMKKFEREPIAETEENK